MTRSRAVPAFMKNCSLLIGTVMVFGIGLSGCVSSGTHEETLAELEKARTSAAKQAATDGRIVAELRDQLVKSEEENRQVNELSGEVRRERDQLKTKADDLQRQLETARQNLASRDDLLNSTMARRFLGEERAGFDRRQ